MKYYELNPDKCIVHPSIFKIINSIKGYRDKRKYLKSFGIKRSCQDHLLSEARKYVKND